jgi:hypothetical protein
MKLILENWRRFVTEQSESASDHNYKIMLDYYENDPTGDYRFFWRQFTRNERDILIHISAAATMVPQLLQNKIKRLLGVGSQGIVFELDNGRALKLYRGAYRETQDDFYSGEAGKIFSGSGKITTVPIFDSGETEYGLKYVEMAKVLPFNVFLKRTGRPQLENDIWGDLEIIAEMFVSGKYPEQYTQKVSEFKEEAGQQGLTEAEMDSIIEMVQYAVSNYGEDYTDDLHEGNFGVLEQSMSSEKPVFVLFDP